MDNSMRLDSHQEGYDSYIEGERLSDNPYQEDTDNWHDWVNGYKMAQDDRREYLDSISPLREEDY